MAYLPFVEPEVASPLVKQVYDDAVARFEMVLNIFKITGHAPEMSQKMWDIFFEILQEGQISWYDKELLILKSTKMGDCLYCVTQHEVVAERVGVSLEKQADIVGVEYRHSEHYEPNEVAILDLCAHIVIDPEHIPMETWTEVKKYYDDGQIVEIVATVGAYLQVSKFGDSLGVELEPVWHGKELILFAKEPAKTAAGRHHVDHFLTLKPNA
ncbi:MAG: hypothetical protein AAF587_26835 [Bacteroidota bacterium]